MNLVRTSSAAGAIVLSCLPALGAGFNVIPPLPDPKSGLKEAGESEAGGFWPEFWHGTGGYTWKGFDLNPTLNYKGFYTDSPLVRSGKRSDDFMHYLTPRVSISRGFEAESHSTLISVAYQPTFVVSSFGKGNDSTYQLVRGDVVYQWGEKSVALTHQYGSSSESSSQTSFLSPQENNNTKLEFKTPVSGKVSADFSLNQNLTTSSPTISGGGQDLSNWTAEARALYQFQPKLITGFKVLGGYSEQVSPAYRYRYLTEQFVSTWNYSLSGKLNLSLEAGGQLVQSQNQRTRDPEATPVVSLQLVYEPRYGTLLTLGGGNSASASQFYAARYLTESSIDFGVRQRVYESFALVGRVAYLKGSYQALDAPVTLINRDYTGYSYTAEFQWKAFARATVGIFYQYLSRVSENTPDSFSSNQIGMSLALNL